MEESIKKLSESMGDISTRLKWVEESITKSEHTIEEFITIKHKVAGAGIFGKWVWDVACAHGFITFNTNYGLQAHVIAM